METMHPTSPCRAAGESGAPSARLIHRYRRFAGYDYSRGASLFVTVALARRVAAFGRVTGDTVALSPAGRALAETIKAEILKRKAAVVESVVRSGAFMLGPHIAAAARRCGLAIDRAEGAAVKLEAGHD